MDAVYFVLDNSLKNEINSIQNQCISIIPGTKNFVDKTYESLSVNINTTTSLMSKSMEFHSIAKELLSQETLILNYKL